VRLGTAALVARPRHVAELLRRRLVAVHWVGDALEAAALLALIPQGVALAHRASPTELEPASAPRLDDDAHLLAQRARVHRVSLLDGAARADSQVGPAVRAAADVAGCGRADHSDA